MSKVTVHDFLISTIHRHATALGFCHFHFGLLQLLYIEVSFTVIWLYISGNMSQKRRRKPNQKVTIVCHPFANVILYRNSFCCITLTVLQRHFSLCGLNLQGPFSCVPFQWRQCRWGCGGPEWNKEGVQTQTGGEGCPWHISHPPGTLQPTPGSSIQPHFPCSGA